MRAGLAAICPALRDVDAGRVDAFPAERAGCLQRFEAHAAGATETAFQVNVPQVEMISPFFSATVLVFTTLANDASA